MEVSIIMEYNIAIRLLKINFWVKRTLTRSIIMSKIMVRESQDILKFNRINLACPTVSASPGAMHTTKI